RLGWHGFDRNQFRRHAAVPGIINRHDEVGQNQSPTSQRSILDKPGSERSNHVVGYCQRSRISLVLCRAAPDWNHAWLLAVDSSRRSIHPARSDSQPPDALRGHRRHRPCRAAGWVRSGDCCRVVWGTLLVVSCESTRDDHGNNRRGLDGLQLAARLGRAWRRCALNVVLWWKSYRLQRHYLSCSQPRQRPDRQILGRKSARRLLAGISDVADADAADQRALCFSCRTSFEPLGGFSRTLSRCLSENPAEDCNADYAFGGFYDCYF